MDGGAFSKDNENIVWRIISKLTKARKRPKSNEGAADRDQCATDQDF